MESDGQGRTEAVGEAWGEAMREGDLLLLVGDLGAGKTTLVRGLARGLGISFGVKSPSFAIHLPYPGRLVLNHLDLYRVQAPSDLAELGLEELFDQEGSVSVVEWGERLGQEAPSWAVWVRIEDPGGEDRRLRVNGPE